MTLFRAARGDLWLAGECLLAFQRGEDSPHAQAGALLHAEELALIRAFLAKPT